MSTNDPIDTDANEPQITIKVNNLVRWFFLGLPSIGLWIVGGWSALSLMGGLQTGSVVPGTGTASSDLSIMWGCIAMCACGGIVVGLASLFRRVPKRLLFTSMLLGFFSLFFTVLT
jgi:hypothetical protein